MATETDIRIARAVALKASVDLVNGNAILLVDLEGKAEELVGWLLTETSIAGPVTAPPATRPHDGHTGEPDVPYGEEATYDYGNEAQETDVSVGGSILTDCPDHPGKSMDSKFENQHRWCGGAVGDAKCGWKSVTFFNDNQQGGVEKVDKWWYQGRYYAKPDYINAVKS